MRKINSRKRPVPERLLRLLVNIHDYDSRVRLHAPAVLKAQVQRAQLQLGDEIEKRHGAFADERGNINSERHQRDRRADGERALVPPPFSKES